MDSEEIKYLNIFLAEQLVKRDDDSISGCVSCSSTPKCNCPSDRSCILTARTCNKCPTVKCVGGSAHKNVGGIAGGVVGGFLLIGCILGFIIWNRKKHNKSNRMLRLEAQEKETLEAGSYKDDEQRIDSEMGDGETRFSSEPGFAQPRIPKHTSSYYSSQKSRRSSKRSSASTFASMASSALSRASNIIPIAYIPGVKVKSDSTFITNRQVLEDLQSIQERKATTFGSPLSTTKAVRAVPKLVDVPKSNLQNEVIYEDEDDAHSQHSYADSMSSNDSDGEGSSRFSTTSSENIRRDKPSLKQISKGYSSKKNNRKSVSGLTHIVEETDTNSEVNELISIGSDDDDEQSDIFESKKRFSQISQSSTPDLAKKTNRPSSSYILDIKMGQNPINPFEDPYEE